MALNNNYDGVERDYLNEPDSVGRPMAPFALLLTFLLIALAALILFVGARWVYNKLAHNSKDVNGTAQIEDGKSTADNNQGGSTDTSQPENQNDQTGNAAESGAESSTATNDPQSGSESSSSATGQSTNNAVNTLVADVPSTGGAESVPNTGPGSLVGLFISVSILGALAHRAFLLKK